MVEITYRCGNCSKTKIVEYRDDTIAAKLHQLDPNFFSEGVRIFHLTIISRLPAIGILTEDCNCDDGARNRRGVAIAVSVKAPPYIVIEG